MSKTSWKPTRWSWGFPVIVEFDKHTYGEFEADYSEA